MTSRKFLDFTFKYNRNEAADLQKRIGLIRAEIDDWARSERALLKEAIPLVRQHQTFVRDTDKLRAEVRKAALALDEEAKSIKKVGTAARKTEKDMSVLERRNKEFNQVAGQVALAGDVASNLSAARGLAGTAGLTGAAGGIGLAADAVDLIEQLPRLKQSLVALPDSALAAAKALGPVGLAGLAGLGAIIIASKLYLDSIQAQSAALGRLVASQEAYFGLLETGTTEDARARLEEEQRRLESLRTQRTEIRDELDRIFRDEQQQTLGDLGARIRTAVKGIADTNFQSAGTRFSELDAQIAESSGLIDRLTAGLEDNAFATNDAAKSAEEAAEKSRQLAEAREREAEAARQRIGSLDQQAASALTTESRRLAQLNQDRRLRAERAEEDFDAAREQALENHQAKLAAIEEQGQERVEQIRSQLSALPGELARAQADARRETADALDAVNKEYMASELAALEGFRKDEARLNRNFERDQKRRLEDHQRSLFEAERDNDILAFIAEQDRFRVENRRKKEDQDQATRDRQTDFDAERQEARESREVRVAELRAGLEAELTDIRVSFEERRAKLAEQEAAERAAIEQRIDAEVAGYAKAEAAAEAARAKQLARQQEDERIADQRSRDALNRTLSEITLKRDAEIAALRAVGAAAANLGGGVGAPARSLSSGSIEMRPGQTSFGGSGGFLTAFARGGIVRKPTVGLVGEAGPELIMPLRPSGGVSGGSGFPVTVQVNGPIQVGEIATPGEVNRVVNDMAIQIGEATVRAIVNKRFKAVS